MCSKAGFEIKKVHNLRGVILLGATKSPVFLSFPALGCFGVFVAHMLRALSRSPFHVVDVLVHFFAQWAYSRPRRLSSLLRTACVLAMMPRSVIAFCVLELPCGHLAVGLHASDLLFQLRTADVLLWHLAHIPCRSHFRVGVVVHDPLLPSHFRLRQFSLCCAPQVFLR